MSGEIYIIKYFSQKIYQMFLYNFFKKKRREFLVIKKICLPL